MGFYSIYKIFKDIFRTLFGNKALRFIFIILISIFIYFLIFNNKVNAYIPDDSNIEDLLLSVFISNTDITQSSLNNSNQYIYCACRDDVTGEYWLFGGLCRESNLNARVFGSVDSTTNYNIRMNMGDYTPNLWLLKLSPNLSVLNSYHKTSKLTGTRTINSFISSYFSVSTNIFRYCNLLFVNNSQLSNFRTYYVSFVPRAGVEYPATITTNEEIASVSNFVICPFDLYINYQGTYRVQSFDLKLYSGSVENVDDIDENNLLNSLTLNENSPYYDTTNTYENIPVFTIPIAHIKLMLDNVQDSQYFTVTYVTANGVVGIENSFYYDVANDTIIGITSNNGGNGNIDYTDNFNEINNNMGVMTNSIDDINSSINDSNIDNITNNTLPQDSTTDITADGVNGIFTSIYNAFCTGNAQDIVFPIPFTSSNITIPANYVYNNLNASGSGWVITIIQAFWWYLISRFIIKDIMDKINKIKSGNIEDIETTNIRGDML